jgi:hypothetical protein
MISNVIRCFLKKANIMRNIQWAMSAVMDLAKLDNIDQKAILMGIELMPEEMQVIKGVGLKAIVSGCQVIFDVDDDIRILSVNGL